LSDRYQIFLGKKSPLKNSHLFGSQEAIGKNRNAGYLSWKKGEKEEIGNGDICVVPLEIKRARSSLFTSAHPSHHYSGVMLYQIFSDFFSGRKNAQTLHSACKMLLLRRKYFFG